MPVFPDQSPCRPGAESGYIRERESADEERYLLETALSSDVRGGGGIVQIYRGWLVEWLLWRPDWWGQGALLLHTIRGMRTLTFLEMRYVGMSEHIGCSAWCDDRKMKNGR